MTANSSDELGASFRLTQTLPGPGDLYERIIEWTARVMRLFRTAMSEVARGISGLITKTPETTGEIEWIVDTDANSWTLPEGKFRSIQTSIPS